MKIEALLENTRTPEQGETGSYILNGLITPDSDPTYFRLYRDPNNKRSYWLINRSDIVGEITPWTTEEKVHAHLIGTDMHMLRVAHGSEFQTVEVTIEKLGETIAGDDLIFGSEERLARHCRPSSGCGSKPCCTEHSSGCRCNNCCIA